MSRPRRPRRLSAATTVLSVALAATVGATVYLAITSLPYLALSPTTDPTFGALNDCLRRGVPERVGFAVGPDARSAAAWSPSAVVACGPDGGTARWELPGVGVLAFDGEGEAWAAQWPADGGATRLLRLEPDGGVREVGAVAARALVGTAVGVAALESPARLLSFSRDGQVLAARDVRELGPTALTASADGERLALTGGAGYVLFEARTLALLKSESPCAVEHLWWRPAGHAALVSCGPEASWGLSVDADRDVQEALPGKPRVPSVLAGRSGVYVQACDHLPCTAPSPE